MKNKDKIVKDLFRTGNMLYSIFDNIPLKTYLPMDVPYSIIFYSNPTETWHVDFPEFELPKGGYIVAEVDGFRSFTYYLKFADNEKETNFISNLIKVEFDSPKYFLQYIINTHNGSDIKKWYKIIRDARIVFIS